MKIIRTIKYLIIITCLIQSIFAETILHTKDLNFVLNDQGQFIQYVNKNNVHYENGVSDLLKIKNDGNYFSPRDLRIEDNKIILHYKNEISATIDYREEPTHLVLELIEITNEGEIDAVVWGPYHISISEIIGEFVGVARNQNYSLGIQSLNPKTVGGFPKNEEGAIFSRGATAVGTDNGSKLQAFSLNRSKKRKIDVWGSWGPRFTNMPVPPIKGETVVGSKIALFGCPEKETLDRIGDIEIAEDLPHPMYNGEWIKKSQEAGRAYMITYFTEENIDEIIEYAKIGGFTRIYHEGPFETWGHFKLNEDAFPNGYDGMKKCVEKAKEEDILIGTHFLTNFITTDDKYITPIPDDRLAVTGYSVLTENIDREIKDIPVESPYYFNNKKADWLHSAVIGDEIIRYKRVSADSPYVLLNCQRGAFDTRKSRHKKGQKVEKLLDHPYKVFFPNFEMQKEIANNIVDYLNYTGVAQIDFDGHEGCYASGQGDYAMDLVAKQVYDGVDHTFLNGSSRSNHFYWHIVTYLNWGEPWYGGFRESQLDRRLKNQALLDRNLMPNMLGWFLLTENSSEADIEWMMARAAGFEAGFAFVTRYDDLKNNPKSKKLLNLVKIWEEARLSDIFTDKQKKLMQNSDNEFHLEKISNKKWRLYPYNNYSFSHENKVLQPGQPTYSEWNFTTKDQSQPLKFSLTLKGEENKISEMYLEVDYNRIEIPVTLQHGETIVCKGNEELHKYNEKGKFIETVSLENGVPQIAPGSHTIQFDGNFTKTAESKVDIKLKTISEPYEIKN